MLRLSRKPGAFECRYLLVGFSPDGFHFRQSFFTLDPHLLYFLLTCRQDLFRLFLTLLLERGRLLHGFSTLLFARCMLLGRP